LGTQSRTDFRSVLHDEARVGRHRHGTRHRSVHAQITWWLDNVAAFRPWRKISVDHSPRDRSVLKVPSPAVRYPLAGRDGRTNMSLAGSASGQLVVDISRGRMEVMRRPPRDGCGANADDRVQSGI